MSLTDSAKKDQNDFSLGLGESTILTLKHPVFSLRHLYINMENDIQVKRITKEEN